MSENPGNVGGRVIVVAVLAVIVSGITWLFWERGKAMSQPVPGVALLPFQALSPDSEYFSDGFTIELINSLSKVEKLRVVSWNIAVRFRGQAGKLEDLRQQLKAGAVVDGTVRRQGDRLQITAKLIDTNNGETIWASSYDQNEREVFKIQEEISKSIVYSLKVPLRMDPQRILVPPRTQSMEAYEDYLKARSYLGTFSREGLAKSSEFAEKAVAKDPNYSPAYALLSANYGLYGGALEKAKQLARKAIEVDSSSGEAHAALGMALGIGDWDWNAAHLELERAAQWSPGSPDVHSAMALGYLMPTNDLEGAEYEARKAVELDRLSFLATRTLGTVCLARGKYQEAADWFDKALAISSDFMGVYRDYSMALAGAGQKDRAAEELAKGGGPVAGPWNEAATKAQSGDRDAAFVALDQAVDQHDPEVVFLQSDIRFANLRTDPRYLVVLKRLKLRQ